MGIQAAFTPMITCGASARARNVASHPKTI
jgi:hypothetical protein